MGFPDRGKVGSTAGSAYDERFSDYTQIKPSQFVPKRIVVENITENATQENRTCISIFVSKCTSRDCGSSTRAFRIPRRKIRTPGALDQQRENQ